MDDARVRVVGLISCDISLSEVRPGLSYDESGWQFEVAASGVSRFHVAPRRTPRLDETVRYMRRLYEVAAGSRVDVICSDGRCRRLRFTDLGERISVSTHTPRLRFAPTMITGGRVHSGHAWLCHVSRVWADAIGGKFELDFEVSDGSTMSSGEIEELEHEFMDGLDWFGVRFDAVHRVRDQRPFLVPEHLTEIIRVARPPAAKFVLQRVMRDNEMDYDLILRGDDLERTDLLYEFLSGLCGGPTREKLSIPCLKMPDGTRIGKSVSVSTEYGLAKLRAAGWEASEVLDLLLRSALLEPSSPIVTDGTLNFGNLRPLPIVPLPSKE